MALVYPTTQAYAPKATDVRWGAQYFGIGTTAPLAIGHAGWSTSADVDPIGAAPSYTSSSDATTMYTKMTGTIADTPDGFLGFKGGKNSLHLLHDPLLEVNMKLPSVFNGSQLQDIWGAVIANSSTPGDGTAPLTSTSGRGVAIRLNPYFGYVQVLARDSTGFFVSSELVDPVPVAPNEWHKFRLRVDSAAQIVYGSMDDMAEIALDCTGLIGLFDSAAQSVVNGFTLGHYGRWNTNSSAEHSVGTVYFESRAR